MRECVADITGYEVFDGCYGTVRDRNREGVYLDLNNGQEAYAFRFVNLLLGSKVLCTVLKLPQEEKRMLVSIDSVVWHAPLAA